MIQVNKIKCQVLEQHGMFCTLKIIDEKFILEYKKLFLDKEIPLVKARFVNKLRRVKLVNTDIVYVKISEFSEKNPKYIPGTIISGSDNKS